MKRTTVAADTAGVLFPQGCALGISTTRQPSPEAPSPSSTPITHPTLPEPILLAHGAPGPEGPISVDVARGVVQQYYQAMNDEDFERLLSLTVGQAHEATQQFIGQIRRLEQQYRVKAQINVAQLEYLGEEQRNASVLIRTQAAIQTSGQLGFFSIPGPTLKGTADYTVELVDGQPKITRLEQRFQQQ